MRQKLTILETREKIEELNNSISEGWLEVSDLYKELAAKPNSQDIKDTIALVKSITRENINESKRLENTLVNL
jgi:hypothetical protein